MNKDLISVIVTCYNRDQFIVECLTSIQKQTYTNFECIIVDDGSTDKSRTYAQMIIDSDPRFRLVPIEHSGFPEAKNVGLANVKGNYVIFLDSDDVAHPEWLNLLYMTCVNTGSQIAVCNYDAFFPTQKYTDLAPQDLYKVLPIREYGFTKMMFLYTHDCMCFMWNKLVKAELYHDIHFEDQPALSDVAVMPYVFEKAQKVAQIRLPLVHYRQHEENMGRMAREKGEEYYAWRFGFEKKMIRYVFDHHPQARFVCQVLLNQEIKTAKEFFKERFDEVCSIDDVKDILSAKVPHFVEH